MNLTLHLVLNDLRRMRVWLMFWIGVLLLPPAVGFTIVLHEPTRAVAWTLPDKVMLLTGLQAVAGYLLTVVLLHEHRLVGTTQYWLTRPISRGRLLGAKAIGIFLMVGLLPVIVSLPWWLWCGFNGGQIINAAGETILVMMLIALAAALLAVLTDSLARALLWTIVLVAALLFGIASFTLVQMATLQSGHDFSLVISRSVVATVVLAVVMLGVVIAQFFLRRRGRWLAVAGGLVLVLVPLAFQWPRGWIPIDPVEFNASLADSVKLRFDRATAEPPPRPLVRGEETFQEVHTHFIASGRPRRIDMGPLGVRHQWRSTIGVIGRVERDWWTTVPAEESFIHPDPETARWLAEKADPRTRALLAPGEEDLRVTSYIPPSLVARMQSEPPGYRARLWWRLMRTDVLFEMPIAISRHLTRDGHGFRVARVERDPARLEVTTVETRPATIRGLLNAAAAYHAWYDRHETTDTALLQQRQGEYLNRLDADLVDPRRVTVNGVEIIWRLRRPSSDQVIRNGKWQWLDPRVDGDRLTVSLGQEVGVFSREVKVERLQILPSR